MDVKSSLILNGFLVRGVLC